MEFLDIGLGGALLESSRAPEPRTRGVLSSDLNGALFTAGVEVRRVLPAGAFAEAYRIAVSFRTVAMAHRQTLQQFIQRRSRL